MNTLHIEHADTELEIEPGAFIYYGPTDAFLTWDQTDGQAIEKVLATIPGVTGVDEWGIKQDGA